MNNRIMKTLAGMALGITIMVTGTAQFGPTPTYAAAAASTSAASVIATGQKYMGVPYQWGAKSGRTDRFDCSSFVQFSFAQNGIQLPRSSRQQSVVGTFVPRDQLQPGDLVFFYSPIHHVAIYMGNGKLLHTFGAPGVTITDLNTGWWNNHYTTARRVLPNGQAAPAAAPVYTAPAAPAYSAPAAPAYSAPAAPGYSAPASKPAAAPKAPSRSHRTSDDNEGDHEGHQD